MTCLRFSTLSPFSVTLEHVPDRELGPLLTHLADAGFENPLIKPARTRAGARKSARPRTVDLPEDWAVVRERTGESYQWPEGRDRYSPYRVFMGTTRSEGVVHIGLGETVRKKKWGRDRKYVVAFLSSGGPQKPLAEFLAADDYAKSKELVAVIRGSDGGRRMYGPGDALPEIYEEHFRTEMYDNRVDYPGVWKRVVAVVREDDHASMLSHALIQGRRRGSL